MADKPTPQADGMETTGLPVNAISTTITALDSTHATLTTADGHRFSWPINHLPAHAKAGSAITLFASEYATIAEERNAIAKSLINELLTPHDAHDHQG